MKTSDLNKPARDKDRYCSPRCGRGCTHSEFTTATETAKKIASILGKPWKPRVWENLGWYWSVGTPDCELHQFSKKHWWADLHVEGKQYTGEGSTAQAALASLRTNILEVQRNAESALNLAPKI